MEKIAIIGDIHGCVDELQAIMKLLAHHSLDKIFHLGDLVDRGPASGEVVQYCAEHFLPGVMGNHEYALLTLKEKLDSGRPLSGSPSQIERMKVLQQVRHWDYLQKLPWIHVEDEVRTVLVHGGLWPHLPIWKQPRAVMYARWILPSKPGDTRWDEKPGEYTASEVRAAGYVPWQDVCDLNETVVYGHTVHEEPLEVGQTIGIDTGCVYGGKLTAVILPERKFVSVKAAREYYRKGS